MSELVPQALGGTKVISRITIGKMLDAPGGIYVLNPDELKLCAYEISKALFELPDQSLQRQKMQETLENIRALERLNTVFSRAVIRYLFL